MTKEEIKEEVKRLDVAIKKHRELAMWGNVESKERLRSLRSRKRELKTKLQVLNWEDEL